MSVVRSISEVGPCQRELEVEVPAAAVEAETSRVLAEFRRKARLPGFRKGKAPANMVRQRYKEDIDGEVLDRLVPRYLHQAQGEADLEPLLPPKVHGVEIEAGAPLTFRAVLEVRPEITLGNIRDFDLPEAEPEPGSEEVEHALEELRRRHGTWKAVDRAASRGDRVKGAVTELDAEGGAVGEPRPLEAEVGHPQLWEEITLTLTGLAAGGSGEFTRREGEGDEATERRFRVEVEAVEELELPALDEEFVSAVGEFEGVPALRRHLEERIREAKRREARTARQQALVEQLSQRHPLTPPPGLVHREVERLLNDYAHELARQGIDLERSKIDWQGMARDLEPRAERSVHARLVLDAVADSEEVRVPEEELAAAIASIAKAQGQAAPAVRRALDEAGKLGELRAQLRRERTVAHLLGETPADGGEAAAAAPDDGP